MHDNCDFLVLKNRDGFCIHLQLQLQIVAQISMTSFIYKKSQMGIKQIIFPGELPRRSNRRVTNFLKHFVDHQAKKKYVENNYLYQ